MNTQTKERYSLTQGLFYAKMLEFHLREKCTHFAIAGSVRRKEETIKNLEIVCVPIYTQGIAQTKVYKTIQINEISEWVNYAVSAGDADMKKSTPDYIEFTCQGFPINLIMATPQDYGLVLAFLTGPRSFTKKIVKRWEEKGYHGEDGKLLHKESGLPPHDFNTEKAFFDWLGWKYIKPEERK